MALRTFRFNPSLGGFGGESSNGFDVSLHHQSNEEKDNGNGSSQRSLSSSLDKRVAHGDGDGKAHNETRSVEKEDTQHHADAFAQIVKELVDNSVDACAAISRQNERDYKPKSNNTSASARKKDGNSKDGRKKTNGKKHSCSASRRLRVRVTIEPWVETENNNASSSSSQTAENQRGKEEILRVTVLDNGVGMEDIETCVDPFRTTKAHNHDNSSSSSSSSGNKKKSAAKNKDDSTGQTAGRYGIGLTLCLLHAQRLVPNSRASIQSTTAEQSYWSVMTCVVDTNGDSVRCFPNANHTMSSNTGSNSDGPPIMGRRPKSFPTESGTAVSVLVPGGTTAALAWPRLAEYFARFKLSRGLDCCLEVLAPTLSKIPLQVVPQQLQQQQQKQQRRRIRNQQQDSEDSQQRDSSQQSSSSTAPPGTDTNPKAAKGKDEWFDFFDDENFGDKKQLFDEDNNTSSQSSNTGDKEKGVSQNDDDDDVSNDGGDDGNSVIDQVCRAAELYLGRPVPRSNVASSIVPIRQQRKGDSRSAAQNRRNNKKTSGGHPDAPQLEVDIVVHGPTTNDDDDDHDDEDIDALPWNSESREENDAAAMVLVRMVNRIPLLDSAEAVACGLVQGLASKKQMWNTFGLQVAHHVDNCANLSRLPVYEVKDSAQVAPFFQNHARSLLENGDDGLSDNDSIASDPDPEDPDFGVPIGNKRKRKAQKGARQLLPAQVRLGNILVIVQIHADPSELPLPTLSKGRLPFENSAIDTALEVALTNCLRQLQRSNPSLLLTAHELRKVERDVRYVPALSMAVASILGKSQTDQAAEYRDSILKWNNSSSTLATRSSSQQQSQHHNDDDDESTKAEPSIESTGNDNHVHVMCKLLETRLRHVLTVHESSSGKKKAAGKKKKAEDEGNESQTSHPYDNDDGSVNYAELLGSPSAKDALGGLLDSSINAAHQVRDSQQQSQASMAAPRRGAAGKKKTAAAKKKKGDAHPAGEDGRQNESQASNPYSKDDDDDGSVNYAELLGSPSAKDVLNPLFDSNNDNNSAMNVSDSQQQSQASTVAPRSQGEGQNEEDDYDEWL